MLFLDSPPPAVSTLEDSRRTGFHPGCRASTELDGRQVIATYAWRDEQWVPCVYVSGPELSTAQRGHAAAFARGFLPAALMADGLLNW